MTGARAPARAMSRASAAISAGALASNQQNAETAAQPVTYALLTVYFASYIVLAADAEGPLASLLTVFPLTAPLVLPARSALVGVPLWQHALAVARRWQRRTRCQAAHLPEEPSDPLTPCATTSLHHRLFARRTLAAVPRLTTIDLLLIEEALLWQTPAHELAPRLGCSVNALHKRNERLRTRLRAAAQSIESPPSRALQATG